ncbi:hypothetical protein ACVINZ_005106 [Mesorhizobium jarvisii]
MDAGDDSRQRRFSAAGFADNAEVASLLDDQADGIDGPDEWQPVIPHRAIAGGHIVDTQQRLRAGIRVRVRLPRLRLEGSQKFARIGVLGGRKNLSGGAGLLHFAALQHNDVVGDLGDDGEVVRNIDPRYPTRPHDRLECFQHVDLRGHVERRWSARRR